MMSNILQIIKIRAVLLLLLINIIPGVNNLYAQTTYPVQANVYLAPPYSNYLSDYYTISKEKLVVTLLNRDQLRPTLEVRLRVSVTAVNGLKIQSREEINYPTITLDAGIPTRLTQGDLEPYFQPQNINTSGSFNQGKLPEGMIEFTFQVIEKHTGKILSAPAAGRAWLASQKPPILRLPSNNEHVAFMDPLNLKFQWEPLHKNISQVEYEFELKELPNNGVAPQSAFLYSIPIYQERLVYTYLMYNVMMPPLDPDKTYAWRVRAVAKDGIDDLNMFDNGGYSEVFCFRTTSNCQPPFNCSADLKDRTLILNWLPSEGNNEYLIQYRFKNDAKSEWKEGKTYDTQQTLYDMKRGATYEFRVGSICTSGQPVFTPTGEITIPTVDSARLARCGIQGAFNLDNKEPIESLKAGDVVMVNDYPMTLTQVSGGGGSFAGEGWIPVNWLLNTKWQVEFDNITINTDKQMVGGSVRAKYDETEGQIANLDEITEGGHENTREGIIFPNYTLEDRVIPPNPTFEYDPQSGELTIYTIDGQQVGEPVRLKNEGKEVFPITIKDKEGNIYQIDQQKDENGEPILNDDGKPKLESTYLGQQKESLATNSFNQKVLSDNSAIVTFEKGSGIYALDVWNAHFKNSVKIRKEYDKLSDDYYASWKFLPVGGSDKVVARVEVAKYNPENINSDSIIFTTQQGIRFQTKRLEDNKYELTLASGQDKDVQEIYALYPKKGSKSQFLTLGKLNIITYPKQINELILVQVNATINSYGVENKLKQIYNPVGVEWSIKTETFNYKGDLSNFIDAPSGAFSAYNQKMKDLINAYKAENQINSKACYMFILKENGVSADNRDKRDAQGIMPRGEQFGFVFTYDGLRALPTEDLNQIVAHELGHGRWRLQHVFDNTYGFKPESDMNKTDNLMDYKGGIELAKWQWEQIYNPAWFTNPFEGDEKSEAAIVTQNSMEKIKKFQNKDGSYTFVTPAGKPITIWESLSEIIFNTHEDKYTDGAYSQVIGTLIGFKLKSGEEYRAAKIAGAKNFTGYLQVNSGTTQSSYYIDSLTIKKNYQYVLVGVPSIVNKTVVFNIVPIKRDGYTSFNKTFEYDQISVTDNNKGDGVIKGCFFLEQELDSYFAHPRSKGVDYIELYAQQDLSDSQIIFLSSLSTNEIKGSEALYVYAIADLMEVNDLSLGCMLDAANWDNLKKTKLVEYIISQYGISDTPSLPGYNPQSTKWKDTYDILLKWARLSKSIYGKDIDKQSLSSLVTLLDKFDSNDGRNCFLRGLTLNTRKILLERSNEWTISSSKEQLLVDIIATTSVTDINDMLTFLKDNNFKMYWKLYDEINAEEAERFIAVVTQLVISQEQLPESVEVKLSVNKQLYVGTPVVKVNPVLFAERQGNGNLVIYPKGGKLYVNGYNTDLSKTKEISPFDFVEVTILEDFRFENIQSANTSDPRLKVGDKLIVPALWIYGIVDRQTTIGNFTAVRVIADICAVTAAVGTGQAEIIIIIDGLFSGLDITVALAEDEIMSSGSKQMQEMLHNWDKVAVVWGTTVLTKTAGHLIINRKGLISYFNQSVRGNIAKTKEFFEQLDLLAKQIRLNVSSQSSIVSFINDIKLTLQLQSKLSRLGQATLEADRIEYGLSQGQKIAAKINGRDHYIGKAIADESSNFTGIDDIQWYNKAKHGDVNESLHVINDVEYTPQGQSTKAKGDLETIKASNGSVYLRVAENYPTANLAPKIRQILKDAGFNPDKIVADNFNVTIAEANLVTEARIRELQEICKKYFPVPKQGEMMQKFISYDDFIHWHLDKGSIKVAKFIAKTEYSVLPKNAEELMEMSRLDYIKTPFAKDKKYVLLRWETEMGDNIIHPFQRNPMPTDELPYTNTGMTGSQYTLMPEYHIGFDGTNDIILNTKFKIEKSEAIVYNADGSIFERYKLTYDKPNDIIIWEKQ